LFKNFTKFLYIVTLPSKSIIIDDLAFCGFFALLYSARIETIIREFFMLKMSAIPVRFHFSAIGHASF